MSRMNDVCTYIDMCVYVYVYVCIYVYVNVYHEAVRYIMSRMNDVMYAVI